MLESKCRWYGRELVVIDRWFPSSKKYSECGTLAEALPLTVREWKREGCACIHDRHVNAAKNIVAAGLAVSACGAGVRSQRGSSRTGRPAVKRRARCARCRETFGPLQRFVAATAIRKTHGTHYAPGTACQSLAT
ncbi:zinc ribbon domain-containing protein [Saccharopolyspora spinosa]|uniref:zinc ribbon domain-containing protein n=1 Tax=Saccharopolyspora spinosa TaxID=60894 RepID=UPI00192B8819|nr:zinc ribbon domain-containing protein [Saccharopolyspora spinosa]